jgi:hypothetical protein
VIHDPEHHGRREHSPESRFVAIYCPILYFVDVGSAALLASCLTCLQYMGEREYIYVLYSILDYNMCFYGGCLQDPRKMAATPKMPGEIRPPARHRPGRGASRGIPPSALRTPGPRKRGAVSHPCTLWLAANPASRPPMSAVSATPMVTDGPRATGNATAPPDLLLTTQVSVLDYSVKLLKRVLIYLILCTGGPKRTTDRERTTARSVPDPPARAGVCPR